MKQLQGPDPAALLAGKAECITTFLQLELAAQHRIRRGAVCNQGTRVTPINLRGIMWIVQQKLTMLWSIAVMMFTINIHKVFLKKKTKTGAGKFCSRIENCNIFWEHLRKQSFVS